MVYINIFVIPSILLLYRILVLFQVLNGGRADDDGRVRVLMSFQVLTNIRYALRLMLEIASSTNNAEWIDLARISKMTGISRRYLEQLVIPLKKADLIHGQSGRAGGYKLSRPASDIMVGLVVEATIGDISITDCAQNAALCKRKENCNCQPIWSALNRGIRDFFYSFTLEDVLDSPEGIVNQSFPIFNQDNYKTHKNRSAHDVVLSKKL